MFFAYSAGACKKAIEEQGYAIVYPYNQKEIMLGQATCSLEFLSDVPDMDVLMAPVSGGGLIAGLALGAKHLKPNIKVYGVSPVAKKLTEALNSGVIPDHWSPSKFVDTHCDALRAHPGDLTFPIMCELLEKQAIEIEDYVAAQSMRLAWQKLKLTIELSTAPVIAALTSDTFVSQCKQHGYKNVGVVLCGGNPDIDGEMPWHTITK